MAARTVTEHPTSSETPPRRRVAGPSPSRSGSRGGSIRGSAMHPDGNLHSACLMPQRTLRSVQESPGGARPLRRSVGLRGPAILLHFHVEEALVGRIAKDRWNWALSLRLLRSLQSTTSVENGSGLLAPANPTSAFVTNPPVRSAPSDIAFGSGFCMVGPTWLCGMATITGMTRAGTRGRFLPSSAPRPAACRGSTPQDSGRCGRASTGDAPRFRYLDRVPRHSMTRGHCGLRIRPRTVSRHGPL